MNRYFFSTAIYYNCISPEDRKKSTIDPTKYPASLGIALEMCAGIIDKDKSVEHIAKEEVLEECGYDVPLEGLHRITSYRFVVMLYWKICANFSLKI